MPRKPEKRGLRDLCAQVHEDDVHPALLREETRRQSSPSRKDLQVCGVVRRVFERVMHAESVRRRTGVLVVMSVDPEPTATRLRVVIAPEEPANPERHLALNAHVRAALPVVRDELAATLARKRLPQLIVDVLPAIPIREVPDA